MNRLFRKVEGDAVSDIVKHTLDVLQECPYAEIHVGTDSQNHRRTTVYVTAIAVYGKMANKRETERIVLDTWRTIQANKRQG